jgi:uncharacterized protein (DUF1800 family)
MNGARAMLIAAIAIHLGAGIARASGPTIAGVKPSPAAYGKAKLSISGSGFDKSAIVKVGGVAFATKFVSPTKLTAAGTVGPIIGNVQPMTVSTSGGTSPVFGLNVRATNKGKASYLASFRLLEQASWGPNPDSIANVQAAGIKKWISNQMAATPTQIAAPPMGSDFSYAMAQLLADATTAPDQLRMRVSFALGQIMVISGFKIPVDGLVSYFNLLQNDAFGNFRKLMEDVTLSPSMGNYLDMVNNRKPGNGNLPNENYARELMQLFSIGTIALNPDGSPKLDSSGNPIDNYGETDIQQLARVFTGWTYPTAPNQTGQFFNPPYYVGPMIPFDSFHDTLAKTVLGTPIAANQTSQQDLTAALDIIFRHPDVGPFVATRLIQHLVKSNPSPAYVTRIAKVFDKSGKGKRGDIAAVVSAILLDPEARAGDKPGTSTASDGHLREPVLYSMGMLRALGATVGEGNVLGFWINAMGQLLFLPPSVFNYYSPLYRINNGSLAAPEFQLMSPSTAIIRADFADWVLYSFFGGAGVTVDSSPFVALNSAPNALLDAVSNALMGGAMPDTVRSTIATAIAAESNPELRAHYALWLAATSSAYQIEH